MSKIKLNKITVSNLNFEEVSSVLGGREDASSLLVCSFISIITLPICPSFSLCYPYPEPEKPEEEIKQ